MSELYGATQLQSIDEMASDEEILEMFLTDDIMHRSETEIANFLESTEAQVLQEKKAFKFKNTLVKLSKQADFNRRLKLISYMLAKKAGDPEWKKLVKWQKNRKASAKKILTKYGPRAKQIAKISQKNYIKKARSMKSSASDQQANAAR